MKTRDYKIEKDGIKIEDFDTSIDNNIEKEELKAKLSENIEKLAELQDKLYAQDNYGILVIIQAMDTAGKDGKYQKKTQEEKGLKKQKKK